MPLITPIQAAYILVIAIIIIGILFEKKTGLENIASNIASFFVLMSSTDLPFFILIGMISYLIIGIFVILYKKRKLFWLFGCRSYGSIALVLLFADQRVFGFSFNNWERMFIGSVVLIGVVNFIGYAYANGWLKIKRRGRKK